MKRGKKVSYCQAPDRDAPRMKCGYPLPCPHHTAAGGRIFRVGVLVNQRSGKDRRK